MGRQGRGRWASGEKTRELLMRAGCSSFRRDGFGSLSMRAAAKEAGVLLGAAQFHYGSQDGFERAIVDTWREETSRAIKDACGASRGLARTLEICRAWIDLSGRERLPLEVATRVEQHMGRDGARGRFLDALDRWIDETHQSLKQANLSDELNPDVDLRAAALNLHRIVWSNGWVGALYGVATSARSALRAVHDELSRIAADGGGRLPSIDALLAGKGSSADDAPQPRPMTAREIAEMPAWKMFLKPGNPRFHAHERHEAMGDPRLGLCDDEILEVDYAAAEAFLRKNPGAAG